MPAPARRSRSHIRTPHRSIGSTSSLSNPLRPFQTNVGSVTIAGFAPTRCLHGMSPALLLPKYAGRQYWQAPVRRNRQDAAWHGRLFTDAPPGLGVAVVQRRVHRVAVAEENRRHNV